MTFSRCRFQESCQLLLTILTGCGLQKNISQSLVKFKSTIEADLLEIKRWCDTNKLCFNIQKTNVLTFKCSITEIKLQDDTLESKPTVKYLGLHIDEHLKFEIHIDSLNRKLASACYIIRTVVHELGKPNAKIAYFSLMESHLRYGIAFWGYSTKKSLQAVFVLQKRAIRYLCRKNCTESCRPLFVQEGILTVPSLFILESVSLIFKKFSDFVRTTNYDLRQNDLPLPIPKFTLTKNSVIYESIKMFNHLPQQIKNCNSYNIFRSLVNQHLVTKAFYSLKEFYDHVC